MKATITLDKAGRLIIPKPIREQMHLREGSRLSVEVVGDRIELCHDADEVQLEKRGKRRVIVGWDGFDAAEAVSEAREQRLDHLASSQDA